VLGFVRVLQRELDRLAKQMSPTELMLAKHILVRHIVIRHANAIGSLSQDGNRFALLARHAAAEQSVQFGRENPRIA
jgi:hypothetical protein